MHRWHKNSKASIILQGHKCRMLADVDTNSDRIIWLGKILEPIEGLPEETHCLHLYTPLKDVVLGMNQQDLLAFAVLAHIGLGYHIDPNRIDKLAQRYEDRAKAIGDVDRGNGNSEVRTTGEAN